MNLIVKENIQYKIKVLIETITKPNLADLLASAGWYTEPAHPLWTRVSDPMPHHHLATNCHTPHLQFSMSHTWPMMLNK